MLYDNSAHFSPDSSVAAYRALNGLPAINLQVESVDGTSDTTPADDASYEAYLDIEVAGAVAKNANIVYVYEADAFTAAVYAIDHKLGDVLSISFAGCEVDNESYAKATFEPELGKAQSEGMTVIAASGDTGAAGTGGTGSTDCDQKTSTAALYGRAVNYPASSPNVTAVGGTEFNEGLGIYWGLPLFSNGNALGYIPEKAWNDTPCSGTIGCASGGGGSTIFNTKPSWQTGSGVPQDGARDVPDLAFDASQSHDGYLICVPNYCLNNSYFDSLGSVLGTPFTEGGTSAATPLFAGIMALVDQRQGQRQGFVNPAIYGIARTSYSKVFHDVTTGNNDVACVKGSIDCPSGGTIGYSAGTGYDRVTGWGSLDANQFALAFGLIESSYPSISSWSVSPTTLMLGGTVAIKYSTSDTGGSGLLRAELWRAPDSKGQPGTWAELGSQSLSGNGPTAVEFTDIPSAAGKYWYGTHLFDGVGNQTNEPSPVQVTVNPTPVPAITVTPTTTVAFGSIAVGSSSTQTFTVKNSGSGTLTGSASVASPFSIVSGGSYSLAAGASQTVTVKFAPTAAQSYSQNVSFTGGAGATRTVTGTGTAAVPAITVTPTTTVAFGSIAVGSSSTQTFTVKNSGSGTLTGSASVASPFSIVSGGSYSLAAGASQTVTVKFAPTAAQSYSQNVSFTGGAGATRTVTGTGTQAATANLTVTSTTCNGSYPEINLSFTVSGGTESTFDLWRNGASYSTGNTGTTFANYGSATVAGQSYSYYVVVHLTSGATVTSNTVSATAPTNCAVPATVTTLAATNISSSGATMNGSVNPNGLSTTVWFQWGTTTALGQNTGSATTTGTTAASWSSTFSGLAQNATIFYRIAAQNSAGTSYGSTLSFTTP